MKLIAAATLLLALFAVTEGSRDLLQATAPASATGRPVADLLFVLSAENATFTSPNSLRLEGVTSTVQFYGQGARAGVIATPTFANSTMGAPYVASNGAWLDRPDASLYGNMNGTQQAVAMTLSSPEVDTAMKTVTFNVTVLATEASATLKNERGVTNELLLEAQNGNPALLTTMQPGTTISDVAIFIDQNKAALKSVSETKTFWWWGPGWGGGWGGGCGWGGCGCGWGGCGWGK